MKLKPIPNNTVVHTPTEEEAKDLLAILHENGYNFRPTYEELLTNNRHYSDPSVLCFLFDDNRRIGHCYRSYFERKSYTILTLAEFKERYLIPSNSGELKSQSAENKPQPKFKVGDKVKIVNDCGCHAYGLIGMVELVESRQVTVACSRGRIYCVPEWLEPYTEPDRRYGNKRRKIGNSDKSLRAAERARGRNILLSCAWRSDA